MSGAITDRAGKSDFTDDVIIDFFYESVLN